MAYRKIKDVTIVTGQYTDGNGQSKNRYKNVGSLMEGDDGGRFILLDRSFNPAGVPFKPGSDQIVLNLFDLRDDAQSGRAQTRAPAPATAADGDRDIPF